MQIDRAGNVFEIRLFVEDFCNANLPPVLERVSLGVLPAGEYELRYRFCASNPIPGDPGDPCPIEATDQFSVAAHRARPIPATGAAGVWLGAFATLVFAYLAVRRQ